MMENQQNLSPKELYEREREAKKRQQGASPAKAAGNGKSGVWWLWLLTLVILAGVVFGVYKLATITPPGGVPGEEKLADPVVATDWLDGNLDAKVQLVEYSDFQCPACAFYAPWVKQLREEFKDDELVVVYRHFPLRASHPNAQIAAQVAEAAGLQGKFWLAADLIFDGQKRWAEQIVARETLLDIVKSTGVNMVKLNADIDSTLVKNKIEAHYQSGLRSGVTGTPSFYLNGEKIVNPQTYEEFRELIIAESQA